MERSAQLHRNISQMTRGYGFMSALQIGEWWPARLDAVQEIAHVRLKLVLDLFISIALQRGRAVLRNGCRLVTTRGCELGDLVFGRHQQVWKDFKTAASDGQSSFCARKFQ